MLLASGDWGETMAETIPGGYYIGEDGRPHDAFGRRLDVSQETVVDEGDGLRAPDAEPPAPSTGSGTVAVKKGRRK